MERPSSARRPDTGCAAGTAARPGREPLRAQVEARMRPGLCKATSVVRQPNRIFTEERASGTAALQEQRSSTRSGEPALPAYAVGCGGR